MKFLPKTKNLVVTTRIATHTQIPSMYYLVVQNTVPANASPSDPQIAMLIEEHPWLPGSAPWLYPFFSGQNDSRKCA